MSPTDRVVVAAGGGALVLAGAAAWMFLSPTVGDASPLATADAFPIASAAPASPSAEVSSLIVDVQGGVAEPGIRELPAGSRVADAIAAAGGYAVDADLAAAADAINLAEPLVDGGQVRVPRIGEVTAAAPPDSSPAPGAPGAVPGGLVNLNTATPEELEALPGIGPVTVQKIVAARQAAPFASLEDAVERAVINRGQLEDLQGLATAG